MLGGTHLRWEGRYDSALLTNPFPVPRATSEAPSQLPPLPPSPTPTHDQRGNITAPILSLSTTLEATQGQIDGFLSQLLFACYLPELASVGD